MCFWLEAAPIKEYLTLRERALSLLGLTRLEGVPFLWQAKALTTAIRNSLSY